MHVKDAFPKNEGESPAPDDLHSLGSSQLGMETDHPPDSPAHSPNQMQVDSESPLISTEGDTDTGLFGTEESRARERSSSGRGRGRGRDRGRGRGRVRESDTDARHPGTQSSTDRGSRRGTGRGRGRGRGGGRGRGRGRGSGRRQRSPGLGRARTRGGHTHPRESKPDDQGNQCICMCTIPYQQ